MDVAFDLRNLPEERRPLSSTLQTPMLDQMFQFPKRADLASTVIENVREMTIEHDRVDIGRAGLTPAFRKIYADMNQLLRLEAAAFQRLDKRAPVGM